MTKTLDVTGEPTSEDLAFLEGQLSSFNDNAVGPAERKTIAVFIRDDSGAIIGGLSGYTGWGWLYVQWLWINETDRGKGLAVRMLDAAEREAIARGCHGALIDTFSPIAERVYNRQGYERFGVLENFPFGHERVFMKKTFQVIND